MARMLGYMLIWTTYGSWLQGDNRGYVKDGKILEKNDSLRKENIKRLKTGMVQLTHQEQKIVREAILNKAQTLGQKIYSMAVCSNHVHIVAERISESIEMVVSHYKNAARIVSHYKNAARIALRANGFVGKVWTRGFDKRFCFNRQQLKSRIEYV
jgi:REP element-mobilizing transposase RayT